MPLNTTLQAFDLPSLIDKMKRNQSWTDGELNAMVLVKRPEKQIVLTALHEGTQIKSFQAHDSVTLQIIEGKLKFHTSKLSVTLDKGQLLTYHEKVKYSLKTREETVFLLTIGYGTLQTDEN